MEIATFCNGIFHFWQKFGLGFMQKFGQKFGLGFRQNFGQNLSLGFGQCLMWGVRVWGSLVNRGGIFNGEVWFEGLWVETCVGGWELSSKTLDKTLGKTSGFGFGKTLG